MQTTKVPILTYHSIDESNSVISIQEKLFTEHIKFLSENDFNVISLKSLANQLIEKKILPPKTIVLTFDDGFENFYTTAFPILHNYNFTATVFLISGYCGKFNDWSGNLPTFKPSRLMDWKKITELSAHNIEFAAHSLTHPDLTKIPIDQATNEMVESKLMIEDHLGLEVTNFAYPYGIFNNPVKKLAEKHFKTVCSTNLGNVKPGDDLFSLKRIDAYYLQNKQIFRSILSMKFDWYLNFRQKMRDLKATWYNGF